jgi:predicted DCC family thiol-disulfide oxidoreductase YuxK
MSGITTGTNTTTTTIHQDGAGSTLLDPTTVSSRVFENDRRPVVLFDGVCNLCNGAVNLALDWDPKGKLRFAALQSNVGRSLLEANGRRGDDISSIVLVTKDEGAFIKSDAILKITEELTPISLVPLKPAAVLSRILVPKFLRDIIYDGVANNRYDILGKRDECRFDSDGDFENRFVDDTIALNR